MIDAFEVTTIHGEFFVVVSLLVIYLVSSSNAAAP